MIFSVFPAGSESIASSRVRIYCLLDALQRREVGTVLGYQPSADVLLVQKRVSAAILAEVAEGKRRGKLVLYDCDDLGPALAGWAPAPLFREMLRLADVVTTNTPEMQAALLGRHRARAVEIIPDAIDYYLKAPIAPRVSAAAPLRLLWFGRRQNLVLLEKYAKVLRSIPDCRLCICTNPPPPRRARAGFPAPFIPWRRANLRAFAPPFFSFATWALDRFPRLLRSHDLCFLPHDGTPADRAKSSNRLIASIAWGTPAIASRTPAYAAAAREMGLPDCLFERPEDVPPLVESLRAARARREYLARAQPWVWENHSADVVAEQLCRTVGRYLRSTRAARAALRAANRA